ISKNTVTVPANAFGGAAGIAVWGNSPARPQKAIIENNIIESNNVFPTTSTSKTEVGGIGVWEGYCRITYNLIRNNTVQWLHQSASCTGGGILVDSESGGNDSMIVIGNIVVGNKARQGGGITVAGNGTRALIHGNTVIGNTGDYAGGGIFLFYQLVNAKVTNNYISGNTSPQGGGIRIDQTGSCYIANNIITQNTASISGGGLNLISSSNIQLVNNTIVGNSNYGVEAVTVAYAQALNNIIWNNTPSPMAGTIYSLNNLTTDPKFTPNDSLFHLSATSPAIGAGSNFATVGDVQLTAPVIDYSGSSRPNPSWSNPDLGAMESAQAFPGGNAIRVPQDQTTIQKGINTAQNGDVVLVSEGTYKENLVINKKITVASQFFVDKDTSHISKTIIDGSTPSNSDSMSVVTIDGATDTTTVVSGFTITGGKGNRRLSLPPQSWYWRTGSGVDIAGGGARISHNIIRANNNNSTTDTIGGSVSVWDPLNVNGVSYVIIENNLISDNILTGNFVESAGLAIGHNSNIRNNTITRNKNLAPIQENATGGGVSIWNGAVSFLNNNVTNNTVGGRGGGIQVYGGVLGSVVMSPSVTMMNNIIVNNVAGTYGGGVFLESSLANLYSINNTIAMNVAGIEGSGIRVKLNAVFKALNTILWNPTGIEISFSSGSINAQNCDIRGGYAGTGNINVDPLFVANDSLYRLTPSSPCINKGINTATVGGIALTAPFSDYFGTVRPPTSTPDLGAFEDGTWTGVKELFSNHIPASFDLSQNYPNPFNPSTTIRYALPSSAEVKLSVYDLLGREIAILVNEKQSAGWKEVEWNAHHVSSGIYFYKLTAGNFVETKKMLVVK
ncbi:MAG: right-handed parallel beta-helix repeat-containing protein, partial [Bacteroidota bacterium]